MFTLTELISIFRIYKIHPKKTLGQNFLVDKNIQRKIISHCFLSNEDIVIEIGAGLGALTEELCKKAKFVYAIEKDNVFCDILKENLKGFKNLEIINKNILDFCFPENYFKFKIVGNLPYYIASLIIDYLIKNRKYISSIFLTLQRELAERITASPGGKDYGAFTVFVNYYTKPKILFPIKKTCFFPQPKVDSCFVKFEVLEKRNLDVEDEEEFFKMVKGLFQRRRKTILNALIRDRGLPQKERLKKIFKEMGIEPKRRVETFTIEDLFGIYNLIKNGSAFMDI